MDIHPVADLFPMMGPQEYEELKNDIKQNGLLEPIVIFKQKVIDGRNRLRACKELGLEPQYKNWNCIGSLVGFVVSKNLHRRHLSESQRALIGAKLKGDYEKDAFERKRLNGKYHGGKGKKQNREQEKFPTPKGQARDFAAAQVKVSGRSVSKAEMVLKKGEPKLVEKVEQGEISIHLASQIVQLPYEDQIKLLSDPNASIFKRLARNLSRRQMEARVKENQERECIARKRLPASDKRFKLYTTDIKNGIPEIPDNSVDLIVTDPPYKSRFIDCYDWLGNFASRVLKHGGCLLVLCGQHHLYEEMSRLNKYLKYYWMLSYTMTGSKSGIGKQRDVFIHWKPVLWYVKGFYTRGYVSDLCSPDSGNIGKSLHIWQQSEMGIRSIMQKFVKVGDVICDPFCGSSTTGVIALEMECNQYIGIDKEQTCIDISRSRLIDRIKELSKKDKIA